MQRAGWTDSGTLTAGAAVRHTFVAAAEGWVGRHWETVAAAADCGGQRRGRDWTVGTVGSSGG